jgi:hypothetical protein
MKEIMGDIAQYIINNTIIKPHHDWEHTNGVLDELKLFDTTKTKTSELTGLTSQEAIITVLINNDTEQVILIAWTHDWDVSYYSETASLGDPQLIQTTIKFTNKWAERAP